MSTPEELKNVQMLEEYLKKSHRFTLSDAVASTGVNIADARKAMETLMEKYHCKLQVTEKGEMLYDFGDSLRRRGVKTMSEHWEDFKKMAWEVFVKVFKVWITIMLVVYFVIFVGLTLVLIIARFSQSRGKSKGGDLGFALIARIFVAIFRWKTVTGDITYDTDEYGYRYKKYIPVLSEYQKAKGKTRKETDEPKKSFIASVYDFVFGPPRVENDPLSNQKEVASYLRINKGIIVLSEMKALAGWQQDQVQEFFTDCVVRFNGDANISQEGVLYGDFENITDSITKEDEEPIIFFWDEYEPPYEMNGNKKGRNVLISLMNLFNFVYGLGFIAYSYSEQARYSLPQLPGLIILMGWIPFIFSLLFFLIPIVRYFKILPKRKMRRIQNIRKRLMRIIYKSPGWSFTFDELFQKVNQENSGIEKLDKKTIEETMKELIRDWDGEFEATEEGKVKYTFPTLETELAVAKRLRKERDISGKPGDIILESET